MAKTTITIEIDQDRLSQYTDETLATWWHVAQVNPAGHGDHAAGELVERIGREIIRRWLGAVPPSLHHHQGRDYYWSRLTKFAKYQPGGKNGTPEWHNGEWVPKASGDAEVEPCRRYDSAAAERDHEANGDRP